MRYEPDPAERARVAEAFAGACAEGEMDALLDVLAEDVVMRSDGGGVAQAARRPLMGADRVARAIIALRRNLSATTTVSIVPVNGTPGMLIAEDGRPVTLMGIDVAGGRVVAIHALREPGKLANALATLPYAG